MRVSFIKANARAVSGMDGRQKYPSIAREKIARDARRYGQEICD
jgi:hypothetical protein